MTLLKLIRQFLRLEIMAAEFYRTHLKHVPVWMQPLIHHFQIVEERHVTRFAKLYKQISGQEAPNLKLAERCSHYAAKIVGLFGSEAILKFECKIEAKAVEDYEQALEWVRHPDVRHAINEVLKEEELHDRLMETLTLFQRDEQRHIKEMQKIITKLQSKKGK